MMMLKKFIKKLILSIALIATSCSSSSGANPIDTNNTDGGSGSMAPRQLKAEESTSLALELLQFKLEEYGYSAGLGVISNGEETFYGVIYSDFSSIVQTDDGQYLSEAGFFQTVVDLESTPSIFTPDKLDEDKLFVGKMEDDEQFIISYSLPNFDSFSFVADGWYNLCKRVGEFVFEIRTDEDKVENYDMDVSCYSFDKDKWVYKSDNDILNFNVEVKGLYSDYALAYMTAVNVMKSLVEIQDKYSSQCETFTYVVISGDILNSTQFSNQDATINGMKLSDLLKEQEQLSSEDALSITADGVSVVKNAQYQSEARVQKGVINLISNLILLGVEVAVVIASWGTSAPVMAVAIIATVAAISASIYAIANIAEAIQDIAYGSQGDIQTKATNQIKEGFIDLFGDEKAGTIAYNLWGIISSVVSNLAAPVASLISRSVSAGMKAGMVLLQVGRFLLVTAIKAAITTVASIAIGNLAGQITEKLTGSSIAAGYVRYVATLAAAFGIGKGLGALDKKFDISGYQLKGFYKRRAEAYKNPATKEAFENRFKNAYGKARDAARKEVVEAVKEGYDPETLKQKYGIDTNNPKHAELLDNIKGQLNQNGNNVDAVKWPSNRSDPDCWEFAHAVDAKEIKTACLEGKISEAQALEFVASPHNGSMVPFDTHLELHNHNFTEPTNKADVMKIRPSISEYVKQILAAIYPEAYPVII